MLSSTGRDWLIIMMVMIIISEELSLSVRRHQLRHGSDISELGTGEGRESKLAVRACVLMRTNARTTQWGLCCHLLVPFTATEVFCCCCIRSLHLFGAELFLDRYWRGLKWTAARATLETLEWLSSLPILMQKSFWCGSVAIGVLSLSPPTSIPPSPPSPRS